MSPGPPFHPVWAEIDLSAIAHNVRELRRLLQPSVRLLAAVKANGYGHGAVQVARTALQAGATDLGVARLDEGIELRRAGITDPILIFGHTPAAQVPLLLEHRLTPSLFSLQSARETAAAAAAAGQTLAVHVKIDTGMGRLGFPCAGAPDAKEDTLGAVAEIARFKSLCLQGIFTHFASSDAADLQDARLQLARFMDLLSRLEAAGVSFPVRHAANSGAIMQMPESHLEMVRAGISLYGLYPSAEVDRSSLRLQPALSLKARVIHVKRVPAGTGISYGSTFRTSEPTTIATVPAGYADGYRRGLSNKGEMLVQGRRVPIVGRVCMDLTMIDVGRLPQQVQVGDEVVLIGRQQDETISADEVASCLDTINYEVVAGLTERVARVYIG